MIRVSATTKLTMHDPRTSLLLLCLACAASACSPPPPDYAKMLAAQAPCPAKPKEGVTVLGAVQHPGRIPLSQAATLTEALTAAGGFTVLAYRGRVRVQRCRQAFLLDVDAIAEQGATDP